jgi:hypothetical protein
MAKIKFRSKLYFSLGVCIALGAGIGATMGNVAVGAGLGAVLGIILSAAPKR